MIRKFFPISRFSDDASLLTVRDLENKTAKEHVSLSGISFTVSPGECFGILGLNGAGKSVALRVLTKDIPISKGNVYIKTNNVYDLSSSFCKVKNINKSFVLGRA